MLSKLAAESIGTFWLVLGGCGSAVLAAAFPDDDDVASSPSGRALFRRFLCVGAM